MSLLRAVRDDLVEKKLWPVAVALLLALVALPVLLTRGGEAAPAPPVPDPALAAPAVEGTAADPVMLAEAATAAPGRPSGRPKDPFRAPAAAGGGDDTVAVDGAAVTVTPEEPPATGGGAGGDSTGSGGGIAEPVVTTDEPAPGPSPDPVSDPSAPVSSPPSQPRSSHPAGYRVDVRWGSASAPRADRDLTRLETLEADGEPQVVFMGVRPDGKTALFLIVGDVTSAGDARCRPSDDFCSLLELRRGDTQFLDVVTEEGVRQYELHVTRVAEQDAGTEEAAEARLERESKAGRRLVRDAIESGTTFVRRYVYSKSTGVLRFAEGSQARAAARGLLRIAE